MFCKSRDAQQVDQQQGSRVLVHYVQVLRVVVITTFIVFPPHYVKTIFFKYLLAVMITPLFYVS